MYNDKSLRYTTLAGRCACKISTYGRWAVGEQREWYRKTDKHSVSLRGAANAAPNRVSMTLPREGARISQRNTVSCARYINRAMERRKNK